MTFEVAQFLPDNPATGASSGQTVNLWLGSRFSPVNVAPATNASPPAGSADYGPFTTVDNSWGFIVTTTDEFIAQTWDPADTSNSGTFNVYWLGPYLISQSSNQQGWTAAVDQTANRLLPSTQIAAGSNGAALPQSTINVLSTTGIGLDAFAASGSLIIQISSTVFTVVQYTGTSGGNSFTGCTGGSGTLATGSSVLQAYQNGNYRRLCFVNLFLTVVTNGDSTTFLPVTTLGGTLFNMGNAGLASNNVGTHLGEYFNVSFPVDPLGWYGVWSGKSGTATITRASHGAFVEVDF